MKRFETSEVSPSIDRVIFRSAIVIVLCACLPLLIAGDDAGSTVTKVYDWITLNLGIFYQWASIAVVVFLSWLAFSRYGKITLGPQGEPAEFSLFSWGSMLFCAGIGAGLMYWSVIEWAYYVEAPPMGAEPNSTEAIEWAASYGMFHWGPTAWSIYCLPTLAIAVPHYLRNENHLRLSIALREIRLFSNSRGIVARGIDIIFILALIGGSGTSLGLVTPMISSVIAKLIGTEVTFGMKVLVLLFCMTIFCSSVSLGLDKGIRKLSTLNVYGLLVLLTFVLLAGPTLFILRMSTDSLGFMMQHTLRMMTWTDPIDRTGFIEGYTVFYWAWWIAYAPFVGLFVARISKGRTIQEVIIGMIVLGSAGCALLYMVFGNYALSVELEGRLAFTTILIEQGPGTAIAEVFGTLPLAPVVLLVFAAIAVIFTATTYDSASYAMAAAATEQRSPDDEPAHWHRAFWAVGLVVLPITLMFVDNQKLVLSATMIVSLPLLALGVPMGWSLMKSLRIHLDEITEDD